jgi:NAD(P)-dependent dehydrogenase (short-subunit alcohol dehydrogenase family)
MLRSRLHQITGELIHVDLSVNRIAEAVSRVRSGGTLPLWDVWMDLSAYEIGADVQDMLSAHFDFCKRLDDQRPKRIVSIGRQSPTHGALVGYYQALSKEWNVDYCGVMDGEARSRISDTALSTAIFALSEWPGAAVVEAHPEQILAWRAMDSEEITDATDIVGKTSATDDIAWQDSDVLLVVGATGITVRIAEAFSRQHPVKMALLDLNPLSGTSYLGPEWDEENHPARKNDILQRLQAEGGKVRPVVLEQEFQRILKQRELQRNIQLLESNHTTVTYLSCDVTDADAVQQAVNTIQQKLGPITGIIHGAGVEISNMIGQKTKEEFLKVIRPKIEGAENLLEFAASDRLKLWLCFSSISGVFGNAAQVDYSAANSFLNSVTLSLQEQNPNVVARCIAWSGWAQTGMAWRNTYVRENAEKIGLHFIVPEEGCDKAVSLMSNTRGPSIQVVHKGLGHMLDNRWQSSSGFPTPLVDRMEKTESGFRFYKKLDVNTDEWLNQHRLLDTPLLPGVGYLEMMAEIYGRNNGFKNGICYENLAFHDAFKLTGEVPREIFIETSVDAEKCGVPVSMKIFSEIKGRLFSDMHLYCTATVSSAGAKPLLQEVWQEPDWIETADHFKVFEGIEKLPQNVIFGNLFHDFKREGANLDGMRYQWNDQALVRDYGFPMEQLDNPKYPLSDYRINFCLMDSLHQAGVVHTVLQTGKVHLPCGASQFVIYDKCDSPERYRNYARCVRREKDTFWYDIFLTNSRGNVCATVFGCEFRKIS